MINVDGNRQAKWWLVADGWQQASNDGLRKVLFFGGGGGGGRGGSCSK